MRRSLSALLVGVLALSTMAAVAPGDVTAELSPPPGQTAVTFNQQLRFGGEVPAGSTPRGTLQALGAGDAVLGTFDVSSRLSVDATGAVSGSVLVGCFYIPDCFSNPDTAARQAAIDRLRGYRLVLTVEDVSDESNIVDFDDEPPIITSYALTTPTTVLVRFSEDVVDPDGDSAADWQVNGVRQVTSVAGSGNSRTLTFAVPQGDDATPEVRYLPVPSPDPRVPNRPYSDGARNELDAANRFALAADRIPPPVPTIATIDGGEVTYADEDEANPVLGNDPSPVVVVEDVPEGDTAQLFLDDGDGNFEPGGDDQFVGEATGDASEQATITVTASLPDGVHRFYAQSQDTALCDPNQPSEGECANTSGRSQEALYDLETVPPTVGTVLGRSVSITVPFSEPVTGTDDAGQWSVDNGAGAPVTVTGVGGSGDRRVLEFTGGPLLPGASLTWTQPAEGAYADEHGNLLATFTAPIELPDLPVVDVVGTDVEEGDPTVVTLPGDRRFVEFVVEASETIAPGEAVRFSWETTPGLAGDATPGDDYVVASGTGSIQPNRSSSDPIRVEVERDLLDEFDEDVFVRVFDVTNAAIPNGELTTGAAILDDDPLATVAFASGTGSIAEGGTTDVTVELDTVSGKPVEVAWSTVLDGTADASDVPAQSGTVIVPAGSTTATFQVAAADDETDEPDETFSVALADPVNAELAGDRPVRTVLTLLDDDLPTLSVAAGEVAEDDYELPVLDNAQLPFVLRLSNAEASDIEVAFSTADGSAVAGADYGARDDTVTIPAGETEVTVLVDVVDDDLDENSETVALVVEQPTGAELAGGGTSLTALGTITDDDPLPTVAFADGSAAVVVDEGDETTLTVELDTPSGRDVLVGWATRFDGTATTADAPDQSGTVLVPAGTTSATFTVGTTQDGDAEDDEQFQVDLTAVEHVDLDADRPTTSTITIADDELVLPTLTVEGGSVEEGAGLPPVLANELVWTFTLDQAVEFDVTARYRTRPDGTATAESDFTGTSGSVTIPAGERTAEVPVTVLDDDLDEFVEEVPLEVFDVLRARLPGGVQRVVELGRITDDDPVVTVSLGDDVTVTEGDPATFDVLLDAVSGKPVTVSWTTSDAGATAGEDYESSSGGLTIPAGEQTASFTITTLDDLDDEPAEDVTVELAVETPDSADLGNGVATLTIDDDDLPLDPGPPVVGLTGASVQEGDPIGLGPLEPPTAMDLEVRLSEPADGPVTVDWTARAGTATADSDFTAESDSVTIADGEDRATITVDVLPDLTDEFDETLQVELTGVTPNARLPEGGVVRTGRILDDDPLATVAFNESSVDVGVTEGGSVDLTVVLAGETEKDASVRWAISFDGGASSADAEGGSGVLRFPAGTRTATVTVATLQDDLDEPDESLSVVLSDPTNAQLGSARNATVTITDDDLVLPTVTVTGGTVDEGAAGTLGPFAPMPISAMDPAAPSAALVEEALLYTAELSQAAEVDVTVDWRTVDTGSAVAGEDYVAASGTLTIPAGETSGQVAVDVLDDDLDEFDELVVVRFSNLRNATFAGGGSRKDVSGRITDDDPLVGVALGDDVEVAEGDPASFDVTLSAVSGKDVEVRVRTVDGAARAGSDYRALDRTLVIPAGETSTTVTVATLDDARVEPTEDLELRLSVVRDDTAELGRSTARLSITDDDLGVDPDATVVSLTGDAVDEGSPFGPLPLPGNSLRFEISLSRPADGPVSVDYETRAGTARAGDDYTSTDGTVTIADGEDSAVVEVPVTPDAVDEFDEDLRLVLTGVRGDAVLPDGELARTGRILDDDPAARLRVSDATVLEGEVAELDVTLDTVSGKRITVDWRLVPGTASAGSDYVADSGTLTFPAGARSRTVTVTTLPDADTDELIEQFELVLSNATNAGVQDARGTISIVDVGVDGLPTTTAVFLEDVVVTEADVDRTALVPVRLSSERGEDTVVTWSSQRLTATDGEDYRAAGGQVVIPAGATSARIPVVIVGDDEVEPNEDFLVLLTRAEGATITGPTGRVTIEDDDADDGGPGGTDGPDGAPDGGGDGDGGDDGAPDDDQQGTGELPATGGGAGFVVLGLALLAGRRRRD